MTKQTIHSLLFLLLFVTALCGVVYILSVFSLSSLFSSFVVVLTFLLLGQSLFNLLTMLFSWNDPSTLHERSSPTKFSPPQFSFTALIPVRDEAQVIGHTIKAISAMNYPENLCEIIVICRADDQETVRAAIRGAENGESDRVKILVSHVDLPNKPAGLNMGLRYAAGDVVVVFDAEDEPNKNIYSVVNTLYVQEDVDVVQAGVQLMNYRSHWYAMLNCLEYYFWFKSSLHAFSSHGVVPLGGNTVFIKRGWLQRIGGWDESKLTEDADVGIRLSAQGANIRVVYDEAYATKEEVPSSLGAFIKQRSRWNQGFYQIFMSGIWLQVPGLWQKFLIGYLLLVPLIQIFWILYIPFTLILLFTGSVPIVLAMFSFLPAYILALQISVFVIGLIDFTRSYNLRMPFWYPIKLILTFLPYQAILAISSIRAFCRAVFAVKGWEKTAHHNDHRKDVVLSSPSFAFETLES